MDDRINRMGLEGAQGLHFAGTKTAAYTLKPFETKVLADTSGGAFTITLPPVALAIGKFYSIILTTAGNTLTIADQGDSYNWTNYTAMDAVSDRVIFYSDGACWWNVATVIAA